MYSVDSSVISADEAALQTTLVGIGQAQVCVDHARTMLRQTQSEPELAHSLDRLFNSVKERLGSLDAEARTLTMALQQARGGYALADRPAFRLSTEP
jgi:hypothetical protein